MSGLSTSTFGSDKKPLKDLLSSISSGKIQLPDFQRGWVWDDERIKSLLASLSLSFPVGTIMLLETENAQVRFKPRAIEGAVLSGSQRPEYLILDGQQRLTALFQSIFSETVVETRDARNKMIKRWYYIDICRALDTNSDRDEAIISLPETRQVVNFRGEVIDDYSTPDKEYAAHRFPLSRVFDSSDWRTGYQEYWNYNSDKIKLFNTFERDVIKRFEQYQMPIITLYKDTPKEAVCQVFEKVNTGGVSLTVFELLTATFAVDDFDLREDWKQRENRLYKYSVLHGLKNDDFLQGIALLTTWERRNEALLHGIRVEDAPGISCKRRDILTLQVENYVQWAETLTEGFEKAARLLRSQKIFSAQDVPYRTQLVPLATVYAVLGKEADYDNVRGKLIRWYWCGVLGELYSSAVETRFAKDLPELLNWINDGSEPDTIQDANFIPNRLLTLKSRNSAAYKGLSALLLRDNALDFVTGEAIEEQMYADSKIDIHHIFPADWCDKHNIDRHRRDCIVNKTPLAARTNRSIGNNAPSVYIARIEREISNTRVDEILRSHVIEPKLLRTDQFETFFELRKQALLDRIERVMNKPIPRDMPADFEKPDEFEAELA
ncbi:MAG: DUF262 domain-containing protein [Anaerolineae bacterium]|nr:DUF262 domain-containing protein [Anaerolineae bacterium]